MIAEIYENHVTLWRKGEKCTARLSGKVIYITASQSDCEWGIEISDHASGNPFSVVFATAIQKGD